MVKNPPANAGEVGSVPRSGRSPGGGNGNSLQYSYLKNPMDRGAWRATVSNKFPSFLDVLYSSGLWRIPSSLAN